MTEPIYVDEFVPRGATFARVRYVVVPRHPGTERMTALVMSFARPVTVLGTCRSCAIVVPCTRAGLTLPHRPKLLAPGVGRPTRDWPTGCWSARRAADALMIRAVV